MAGSWKHITTKGGKFQGVALLDNLGDAYEALEQCYGMVHYLAAEIAAADDDVAAVVIDRAREHYRDGLALSPGVARSAL